MRLAPITVLVMTSLFACSCGKKELDRETATKLVQGHGQVVQGSFFVLISSSQLEPFYQQLVTARVISCPRGSALSDPECVPAAPGLSRDSGQIVFVAGNLMPVEVTGVTKTGDNSAVADVRLSFEPTPMYAQSQVAFDQLDANSVTNSKQFVVQKKQRTAARATFQLYDDGWRFQSIQ